MKNNFQSKAVPRGTRTIWRYLSALILFFALSIGQMWGADVPVAYTYESSASKATMATNDFFSAASNPTVAGDGVFSANSSMLRCTVTKKKTATVTFTFTAKTAIEVASFTFNSYAGSDKIKSATVDYYKNSGTPTNVAVTFNKSTASDKTITPTSAIEMSANDVLTIVVNLSNTDKSNDRPWNVNTITLSASIPGQLAIEVDGETTKAMVLGSETSIETSVDNASGLETYQWYKTVSTDTECANGTIISGAESDSYTPDEESTGSYYYYCMVTDGLNTAKTELVTVNVFAPLTGWVVFDGLIDNAKRTSPVTYNTVSMTYETSDVSVVDAGSKTLVGTTRAYSKLMQLSKSTSGYLKFTVPANYTATFTYAFAGTGNRTIMLASAKINSTSADGYIATLTSSVTSANIVYGEYTTPLAAGDYYICEGGNGNWQIAELVFTLTESSTPSTPVDPEFTYTPATYTIGDPALDLSTKLTSTNTTGAITFAVSSSDAGTTGASIANGKNFTATTAGTATITVSQEATTGYNAKTQDITVTVQTAPEEKAGVKMIEAGALTGNFRIKDSQLKSLSGTNKYTIDEIDYTKYILLSSSSTGFSAEEEGANTKNIFYTLNKENTRFWFYAHNGQSSNKKIYAHVYKEGSTSATSSNVSVGEGNHLVYIDIASDKNAEVHFSVEHTDVQICQIVAVETGDALPQGGEVGYVFDYSKKRLSVAKEIARVVDGIEYYLSDKAKISSGANAQLTTLGTHYIKFHLNARTKVSIECDNKPYKIGTSKSGETAQIYSGQDDGAFNLTEGDWYINGAGETVKITKLSFLTPDAAYAVTYNAGEGSVKSGKSLPTHADAIKDEVITLASGENLEKEGYDFTGWKANGTGDLLLAGAEYTMGSAAVEFVAQWQVHVAKYGVKFMDGEEKLDSLSVTLGQAPSFANPTKALHTFTSWRDGEDHDIALSDLATTVTVENTELVLYAQWTKAYALSVDIEDYAINTSTDINNFKTWFSGKGYNYANLNAMDKTTNNNGAYAGVKTNSTNAYYEFRVVANKRVTIKLGYMASAAEMYINGVKDESQALTGGSTSTGNDNYAEWYYDITEESIFKLQMKTGSTCVLKAITIGEIPVESDDATLSDLKVGDVTVAGFNSAVNQYYVELPYGTAHADFPVVTVTTNEEHAIAVVNDAKDRTDDITVVHVTAQNGVAEKYYNVYFSVAPKLGVELIKATHTGAKTASKAGYWTADATVDKNTYDNSKLGGKDNYFGLTLGGTKKFMNGDLVVIYLDPAQAPSAWLQLFKDKGSNIIADVKTGVKKGANYITLADLPAEGIDQLYLYRTEAAGGNMNPYANYIAVYRQMAPFIESFEIEGVDNLEIDQTNKTITASVANSFDVTALTPTVKYWANGGGSIDKTGAQDFTNPVQYTVSSAYTEDAHVTYTVTITKVVPSVEPTITTQPQGANYYEGASIAALTVAAESTAGELSYQWQVKNGLAYDDIEGATAASYTPTVSAIGSYIYRVVVTNTEDSKPATSVNSEEATVEITSDPACATFVTIPTAEPYQYTNAGEWTIYNASSSGKRNGSDQIFGDVKDFEGNTVKGFAKERCVLIFEKDMKQVRFYSANAQRAWGDTPIRVSGDVETFLGTGTPSYSAYAATTSIIQNDPNNNKEQIFIADGEFLAGKCYWFAFSGSLQIFQICAVEADPKADAPVFSGALSDEAICPGNTFATLDATASPVTSYAWYKDDEVIENAEAATYTPTEAGTYYCIATNSAAGYRSASTKSAEAVLSVNTVTAITAHVDAVGTVDAEKTISVTAEGTNLTYQWQACDANGDVTDATVLGTAASLNVVIAAETKYYLATVTGACGVETQVVEAREWHEVEPVNVTGSRVWNWTSAAFNGIDEAIAFGNTSVEELMANVSSKVPNYESFRSDMLYGTGQYVWRPDDRYFQGFKIRFVTTVPGIVKVTYRGTGNNKNIILTINDSTYAEYQGGFTTVKNFVQAGEVVIEGVGGSDNAGGMTRIQRIEFVAEDDYHRTVNPANIGTLCWTNNAVLVNATLYELAGKDANSKLVFDEVEGNKLVAGKPYIFVPENGNTQIKVFNTDDAEPMTEAQLQPVNYMYGTLAGKTLTQEDDAEMYYFSGRNIWRVADFNVDITIPANCCYVDYPAVLAAEEPAPAPAPGRRRITMGGKGANAATGFESIDASEKPVKLMIDGQIFILRGEKMYDATGRLVK